MVFHGVDGEGDAGLELGGGEQLLVGVFWRTFELNRFGLIFLCGPQGGKDNKGCDEQGGEVRMIARVSKDRE